MEWVVVKSKFQVFLVPNYRAFRMPVKYVSCIVGPAGVLNGILNQSIN